MEKNMDKGILIAIEGIDGAGKSTQVNLLDKFMREEERYDVLITKEPTNGYWGQKIREIEKKGRKGITPEDELSFFIKDRKEHVENVIIPALKENKIVITDRYYFSTMAYQGALGLDFREIQKKNEEFAPIPDILIIIDISPEEGIRRIKEKRGERPNKYEEKMYLTKVRDIFKLFARTIQSVHQGKRPIIHIIDGSQSNEDIFTDIKNQLLECLS
ncbi:MAG: dTMP kinase [Nitrospirota bacterium]